MTTNLRTTIAMYHNVYKLYMLCLASREAAYTSGTGTVGMGPGACLRTAHKQVYVRRSKTVRKAYVSVRIVAFLFPPTVHLWVYVYTVRIRAAHVYDGHAQLIREYDLSQ